MREVDLRVATYDLLPRACNTYLQSPVPVQGFTCRGVGHTLLLFGGQAKKNWLFGHHLITEQNQKSRIIVEKKSSDEAHVM